jgi:adenine-specific DNA methylase
LPTKNHRKTLENNLVQDIFRPIHYLGSKLRILDFIEDTIDSIDPSKGKICDLFSGSGSVSFKLARNRPVISVDVQEYSRIISSSLLNPIKINQQFLDNFFQNCLHSKHSDNLHHALSQLINYENLCMQEALKNIQLEGLCEVIENGSIISYELTPDKRYASTLFSLIEETIAKLKTLNLLNNKSLAIRYFGGVYFSYHQAVQIDAILEEIEKSPTHYQNLLLAALLSTASECVNTVGKHFAQPIRPRNTKGKIKPSLGRTAYKDRQLDIIDIFINWVSKYNSIKTSLFNNEFYKMDYLLALESLPEDVSVVYADPPYTRDHYSRFYHVLETLALRDTPKISTMVLNGETLLSRGLYRENRHQSPFCIRSQAPNAFHKLFAKVSIKGAKIVLSYSPYDESKNSHPRVVTLSQIINIAKIYYSSVEVLSPGMFTHSKLNKSSRHLEALSDAEVLIVCT